MRRRRFIHGKGRASGSETSPSDAEPQNAAQNAVTPSPASDHSNDPLDAPTPALAAPADIPAPVWALLQEGGARAAQRMVELLDSAAFPKLPASTKVKLIDLALTRAYGLPVKRSVSVELGGSDADAVAAALLDMHSALPERRQGGGRGRNSAPLDVTPHDAD